MHLYETQHFLFFSDLPPQRVKPFTSCLDAMHDQLCTAYAIQDKDSVWLGKLPVVAFSDASAFEEREKTFFNHPSTPRCSRACAQRPTASDRHCHCGKDPTTSPRARARNNARLQPRYISAVQLPSWLDEGLADWSAMNVVHKNDGHPAKVQTR